MNWTKLSGALLLFVGGFKLALWLMLLPSIWFFMQQNMKVELNPIAMQIVPYTGLGLSLIMVYIGWKQINNKE